MSIVVDPTSAKAPVGKPASGSRLAASGREGPPRRAGLTGKIMRAVRNLARFAYDLLHDLF